MQLCIEYEGLFMTTASDRPSGRCPRSHNDHVLFSVAYDLAYHSGAIVLSMWALSPMLSCRIDSVPSVLRQRCCPLQSYIPSNTYRFTIASLVGLISFWFRNAWLIFHDRFFIDGSDPTIHLLIIIYPHVNVGLCNDQSVFFQSSKHVWRQYNRL